MDLRGTLHSQTIANNAPTIGIKFLKSHIKNVVCTSRGRGTAKLEEWREKNSRDP
jgi:hypothetical protein